MVDWTPGAVLNLAGSIATLALGLFLLGVRPLRPPQIALAVFAISLGTANATNALGLADSGVGAFVVNRALLLIFAGALVGLALVHPRPLRRVDLPYVAWAAAGGLVVAAAFLVIAGDPVRPVFLGPTTFCVALMALRHRRLRDNDQEGQRQLVLFCVAAGAQYYIIGIAAIGASVSSMIALLALVGVSSAFWAAASWRPGGAAARNASRATLIFPVAALLGMLASIAAGGYAAYNRAWGVVFLPQLWLVCVLVYGILRHRFLGMDLQVRWTISKSTIAAVFIAVFFVASEGAQQFFGDTFQGPYVGIAAAGMLVFVIAPLQRVAERLAEKAVPPDETTRRNGARPAETYRRAVRLALRDRRLTHEEEIDLAVVADGLGISAPDAVRIRHEVERETAR